MIINLIDKLIKIPAIDEKLIMTENNPKEIFVEIPKTLLTSNVENSNVYILSKLNENEVKEEKIEIVANENEKVIYKWIITNEHTAEEGKLSIQIKIERTIPETLTDEEIEQKEDEADGANLNSLISNIVNENNSNEEEESGADSETEEDTDAPVGFDEKGVWYSYQNFFTILKVLQNPVED